LMVLGVGFGLGIERMGDDLKTTTNYLGAGDVMKSDSDRSYTIFTKPKAKSVNVSLDGISIEYINHSIGENISIRDNIIIQMANMTEQEAKSEVPWTKYEKEMIIYRPALLTILRRNLINLEDMTTRIREICSHSVTIRNPSNKLIIVSGVQYSSSIIFLESVGGTRLKIQHFRRNKEFEIEVRSDPHIKRLMLLKEFYRMDDILVDRSLDLNLINTINIDQIGIQIEASNREMLELSEKLEKLLKFKVASAVFDVDGLSDAEVREWIKSIENFDNAQFKFAAGVQVPKDVVMSIVDGKIVLDKYKMKEILGDQNLGGFEDFLLRQFD
jgi:hypothetical protein